MSRQEMKMKLQLARVASALTPLSLGLALLTGCDDSAVVSQARLRVHMLNDTAVPLDQSARSLPSSGRMTITPYDVHAKALRSSLEFDLSTKTGALPELPIGLWRFMVSGEGGGYKFYGTSGEFEIKDNEAREVHAIVGQEQCTGLLPSMPVPPDHPFAASASSDLPGDSVGSAIAELPNGQILITGGGAINAQGVLTSVTNKIYVYDPAYGLIFPTEATLNVHRAHHRADQLDDGRILITGGYSEITNGVPVPTASAELIELDANGALVVTANTTLQINTARAHHATVKLTSGSSEGKILITGGLGSSGAPLKDVTLFDPTDNTFRAQGLMAKARAYHAMAPLDRSAEPAIVIGGMTESGPTNSVEMFTTSSSPMLNCMRPSTAVGCFISGGSLASERWGHVALKSSVKPNTVVIAGGYSAGTQPQPTALASAIEAFTTERIINGQGKEVDQPTIKQLGVLSVPRAHLSGVRLQDDTLLLAGGEDLNGNALNEVTSIQLRLEGNMINPSVNSRCPLSQKRVSPSVITTRDGGAIIMGGRQKGVTQAGSGRVELFYPAPPSLSSILDLD